MRYFIISSLLTMSAMVAGYAARTHAADQSSRATPPAVITPDNLSTGSQGAGQHPSGITSPPMQPPNLTDGAIKKAPPEMNIDNTKESGVDCNAKEKRSGCGIGNDMKREQ